VHMTFAGKITARISRREEKGRAGHSAEPSWQRSTGFLEVKDR
jgi:hypothetical protein